MRAAVREIAGQRGLRIAAPIGLDAGGGAAERMPPVGADGEARRDRVAAATSDGDAVVVDLDRLGLGFDQT